MRFRKSSAAKDGEHDFCHGRRVCVNTTSTSGQKRSAKGGDLIWFAVRPVSRFLPPPTVSLIRRSRLIRSALLAVMPACLLRAAADAPAENPALFAHPLAPVYAPPIPGAGDDIRNVVQTEDGTLLAGANQLMSFDGMSWRPLPVTGANNFRALATSAVNGRDRVWIGAFGALGYAEPAGSGNWEYHSLLPELARSGEPPPGQISAVRALGRGAVWLSDRLAMRWMPGESGGSGSFDVWRLETKGHLSLFGGGDEVFIHQEGTGLLRLTADGAPALLLADSALPASPITWLVPAVNADGDTLVGLQDDAYVLHRNRTFAGLPELSAVLRGAGPTCALAIDTNRIAIGTLRAGVVLVDTAGRVLERNLFSPAADAAVHALFVHAGQLWVASTVGIARLEAPGSTRWFERQGGLGGGRPLRTLALAGRTFVLTSNALLVVDEDPVTHAPWLRPLHKAPATFSQLVAAGGELWVSGFGGLWRLAGDRLVQEYAVTADVVQPCATRNLPHGLLFFEGGRIKALEPDGRGNWDARELGAEIPDSAVSVLVDSADNLWVSTLRQGVLRFAWDSGGQHLYRQNHLRPGAGLPASAGRVTLTQLGDRLLAFTSDEILGWREDELGFVPASDLSNYAGVAATDLPGRSNFWLVRSRSLANLDLVSLVRAEAEANGTIELHPLLLPGLAAAGSPNLFSLTGDSARGQFWVGSSLGLLRIEAAATTPLPPPGAIDLPAPYGPEKSPIFYFPTPASVAGTPIFYQTRLEGVDPDWSPPTRVPARVFSALDSGRYRFEVRLVDGLGRIGPVSAQRFVVRAPWWRTSQAYAGYAGLGALLVALFAQWRVVRLRRLNQRLNQLVAERTREIELSSTAKSNFLENISHEIRNPLNGLTGLLDLLKEDHLDPRERDIARSLKSVATTLTQVFEDVLQFSKLEYGYGRIEAKPFALRPLLDEIVCLFGAQAAQAGCTLHVTWPADLADGFEGDRDRIKTILANFVSNAVKYAPGAPVEIRLESTGETDGLVDLYLDVVDHGPGVPTDEQELIFRKFIRGRRAQSAKIPGSGLGLATCAMLAKLMNGSVGVESKLGQGATFSLKLLLPRATPPAAPDDDLLAPNASSASERWLIVDDEDYNRAVLVGIARELGVPADEAVSAREAAEHAAAGNHTAVFLDWELPDGNGGEIARRLRAQRLTRPPLILATTAHDSEEMRDRCRAAGMDGFILKPYNAARLRAALAAARASSRPEVPVPAASEVVDLSAFDNYARARNQTSTAARDAFFAALDAQSAALDAALALGDNTAIAHAAHRLRGLAGVVNATQLNLAAARLEQAVAEGSSEVIRAHQATVQRCVVSLRRELPPLAASTRD